MAIAKITDQVGLLRQSLPDARVHPAGSLEGEQDFEYLYREDTLLMRDADRPVVARFLGERDTRELDPKNPDDAAMIGAIKAGERVGGRLFFAENPIPGLTRLRYTGLRNDDPNDPTGSVPDLLAALEREGSPAVTVRPDTVLHVTGNCCPAHEPEVPVGTDPVPPVEGDPACGAGVLVSVVDTGFIPAAAVQHAWLDGVVGDAEATYEEGTGNIKDYAGHGTFVSGCVRVIAPGSTVHVAGNMTSGGATYDSDLVGPLQDALSQGDPDRVVVFPFTSTTRNGGPLAGFDHLYETVIREKRHQGMVIISSAGCDDTNVPSYPAAYKWVVSVGALTTEDPPVRADFSNFGPFVDVFVRGEDLVNAYATGTLVTKEHDDDHDGQHDHEPGETRTFDGMANWSGTSFATGLFAGMVAARKSHTGETARDAAQALLDLAEDQYVDDLGPVLRLDQACPATE